jgi:hypothetical protein
MHQISQVKSFCKCFYQYRLIMPYQCRNTIGHILLTRIHDQSHVLIGVTSWSSCHCDHVFCQIPRCCSIRRRAACVANWFLLQHYLRWENCVRENSELQISREETFPKYVSEDVHGCKRNRFQPTFGKITFLIALKNKRHTWFGVKFLTLPDF